MSDTHKLNVLVSPVLTPDEAARILNIGRNACYAAIKKGTIPSVRIGRLIRVPRSGLHRLIEGC